MEQHEQEQPQDAPEPARQVHLELLLMLLGLLVIQSFMSSSSILQRSLLNVLFLAVVLSGIRTLSASKTRLAVTMFFGAVAFLVSFVSEVYSRTFVDVIVDCCYVIVFTALTIALCESVFVREGPVDGNRIVGAVSVYFVLGLVWAFAYTLLETVQPGSFAMRPSSDSAQGHQAKLSEFMYFSNVTLTTLGYGDIVPISRPAQMMATLQALFGQLYLTVVVARLVGLHIARQRA